MKQQESKPTNKCQVGKCDRPETQQNVRDKGSLGQGCSNSSVTH